MEELNDQIPTPIILKPQTEDSVAKKMGLFVVDFLQTFIIAAGVFVLVYHFLFQPNQVLGASMDPTFMNGEYILTDKISYRLHEPRRGDVVIFKHSASQDYVKRVVGLPGESVLIHQGKIYIFNSQNPNGVELKEPYLESMVYTDGGLKFPTDTKTVVPPDSYFVLGDNRERSSDSRAWGTVNKADIVGRATFRYWPPPKFGPIK